MTQLNPKTDLVLGGTTTAVPGTDFPTLPLLTIPATYSSGQFSARIPDSLLSAHPAWSDWHVFIRLEPSGGWESHGTSDSWYLSGGGQWSAFIAAWNPTLGNWTTGPETTFTVATYQTSLAAPTFSNSLGTALSGTFLVDSGSFILQIASSSAGQVIYTLDSTDPVPGKSPTWNGAQDWLSFPTGSNSLLVKAMAWQSNNQISPVAQILVTRPAWNLVDPAVVGCLRQVGLTKVLACGDARGPLNWTASGWVAVDGNWSYGTVRALSVSDTEVLVSVGAQVWRSVRSNAFMAVGAPLAGGAVAAVTRYGDSLWASAPDGVYEWDGSNWNLFPGSPAGTTMLWSGPDALWAAVGSRIWKMGWASGTRAWVQWLDPGEGVVAGMVPNPWTTGVSNGPVVVAGQGLVELDPTQAVLSGNLVADASAAHSGLRQVVPYTVNYSTRVYAAFDNGGGSGGVARAGGWNAGWSQVGTNWPVLSAGPLPSQGVAIYKMSTAQILAITSNGTYSLPLP